MFLSTPLTKQCLDVFLALPKYVGVIVLREDDGAGHIATDLPNEVEANTFQELLPPWDWTNLLLQSLLWCALGITNVILDPREGRGHLRRQRGQGETSYS